MNWLPYSKSRFSKIGDIINPNPILFPPRVGGRYVTARCINRLSSDTQVVVGNVYPLFWPDFGAKCDAPNPPFQTGEGFGILEDINYLPYSANKFEILGDFSPDDPNTYPMPGHNGQYKVAKCIEKLSTDIDAKVGGIYIIIVYADQEKVDAPNPPFGTGDGQGIV